MNTTSHFASSGPTATAAGIRGLFASSGNDSAFDYTGNSLQQVVMSRSHGSKIGKQETMTPPGWAPKEPAVQPTWAATGAGVVSAGCIDNTYTVVPLQNRWGKARERATKEMEVLPHKQASDLLIAAKGGLMPTPAQDITQMASVRPLYSKTIPLYHPIDPQRQESGFIRSPNIIPGAGPVPQSPLAAMDQLPDVPADWAKRKLAYDQRGDVTRRLPVSRTVRDGLPGPKADAPIFLNKAAGLPGGLSLTG